MGIWEIGGFSRTVNVIPKKFGCPSGGTWGHRCTRNWWCQGRAWASCIARPRYRWGWRWRRHSSNPRGVWVWRFVFISFFSFLFLFFSVTVWVIIFDRDIFCLLMINWTHIMSHITSSMRNLTDLDWKDYNYQYFKSSGSSRSKLKNRN